MTYRETAPILYGPSGQFAAPLFEYDVSSTVSLQTLCPATLSFKDAKQGEIIAYRVYLDINLPREPFNCNVFLIEADESYSKHAMLEWMTLQFPQFDGPSCSMLLRFHSYKKFTRWLADKYRMPVTQIRRNPLVPLGWYGPYPLSCHIKMVHIRNFWDAVKYHGIPDDIIL